MQLQPQDPEAAAAESAVLDTLDLCWPDIARWMPHMPHSCCQACTSDAIHSAAVCNAGWTAMSNITQTAVDKDKGLANAAETHKLAHMSAV